MSQHVTLYPNSYALSLEAIKPRLLNIMRSKEKPEADPEQARILANRIKNCRNYSTVLEVLESANVSPNKFVYNVLIVNDFGLKDYSWAIKKFIYNNVLDKYMHGPNFNCFINEAKKAGDYVFADLAFARAKHLNVANVETFINYLCTAKNFDRLSAIFEEAPAFCKTLRIGRLIEPIYTNFIILAGRMGHFQEAENVFMEIGDPTQDAFQAIISAAEENGYHFLAERHFNEMEEKGIATTDNYAYMVRTTYNRELYDQALAHADKAIRSGHSNAEIYHLQIDILVKQERFNDAYQAFCKAVFPATIIDDNPLTIDLRGYSCGAAMMELQHFAKLNPHPFVLAVVCRNKNNPSNRFQSELKKFIASHLNGINCDKHPNDTEKLILRKS